MPIPIYRIIVSCWMRKSQFSLSMKPLRGYLCSHKMVLYPSTWAAQSILSEKKKEKEKEKERKEKKKWGGNTE